jgi:hypothetical protein
VAENRRSVEDPSDDWGYRPQEVALLRRMLAAGVSRFHPHPMQAIAEAERNRVARTKSPVARRQRGSK